MPGSSETLLGVEHCRTRSPARAHRHIHTRARTRTQAMLPLLLSLHTRLGGSPAEAGALPLPRTVKRVRSSLDVIIFYGAAADGLEETPDPASVRPFGCFTSLPHPPCVSQRIFDYCKYT